MKSRGIVTLLLLLSLLTLNSTAQQQQPGKPADLSYYQWYGKRFDWILDLWSRNPAHRDSIPLFMREIGTGKDTFLVLHGGWGAEHSYLLDALLPLADKAHFIFYDQRGSLRSPCADSVLSVNDHLNDIERIRKAFKSERINLIGHSMGTWLAMAYLEKYPDRAGKLILLSSLAVRNGDAEERKANAAYNEAHFNKIYKQQEMLQPKVFKRFGLPDSLTKEVWQNMSQSKKYYINLFWAASGKIVNYDNWEKDPTGSGFLYKANVADIISRTMPRKWDFTESIRRHPYSVIFIKADGDYLAPEFLKENITGLANARFVLVNGAGHNMWLEQPGKFREEMSKAIKE